jgi:hypothetical protein
MVWILYKERELDFNQSEFEDVEIFESKQQAEQAAYWLNDRLSSYDKDYNGWHVGEQRIIRTARPKHKHRASCHGAIGELLCGE